MKNLKRFLSGAMFIFICSCLISSNSAAQALEFSWLAHFGEGGVDAGSSVTIDASNNVYSTGAFADTSDFDPGPGTSILIPVLIDNAFISKLDAAGNFIWVRQISGDVRTSSLAVDGAGNLYVAGYFEDSVDFDPGTGTSILVGLGNDDLFVSKFDAAGNFLWAKSMGGPEDDQVVEIDADAQGNVFLTGFFKETVDFDPNAGVMNLTAQAGNDVFICKLDASGNLVFAKAIGGSSSETGQVVKIDLSNNVIVAGIFKNSVDFDPGSGTNILTAIPFAQNGFILKLDSNGDFVWAKSVGGEGITTLLGMDMDAVGNIVSAGQFNGIVDFDPGPDTLFYEPINSFPYYVDIFVLKLDPQGDLGWAFPISSESGELARALTIDGFSNIYITGNIYMRTDFDPSSDSAFVNTNNGTPNAFIAKFDPSGNYIWAGALTSSGSPNNPNAIAVDHLGGVAVIGEFSSSVDFDPGPDSLIVGAVSSYDAWLLKLSDSGVGIQESWLPNPIKMYPNPLTGNLVIATEGETKLSIMDIWGREIENITVIDQKVIDTQDWPMGVYLVRDQSSKMVGRLVKQ